MIWLVMHMALAISFIGQPRQPHLQQPKACLLSHTDRTSSIDTHEDASDQSQNQPTSLMKHASSQKWQNMVTELDRFYNLHGHSLVTMEQNPELARWCRNIRCNYKHQIEGTTGTTRKNQPTLSEEKLKVLSKLNFVWNIQKFQWNQRFRDLCSFRAKHGHCDMRNDEGLGMWVHNQKCSYRALLQGKPSNLTPERLAALTSIGLFDEFQTHSDLWNQRYMELQEFHQTVGHSIVPEDYVENYQLGQWVMNQRLSFKAYLAGLPSSLTPERIAQLEKVEFRWNVQSHQWFSMLHRLDLFARTHGHLRISTSDMDNQDLRQWLIHQRHAHLRRKQGRSSSMTEERQTALTNVPYFEWSARKGSDSSSSITGPKLEDWDELFTSIREKGIVPGMRPKQHWFEGQSRFEDQVKDIYTDDDLLDLWNQEDDEEE